MSEPITRAAENKAALKHPGLVGIALLALLLSGGLAFGASGSDEPPAPSLQVPTTGMKTGRITAKHEKSVEISGNDYAFHAQIELGDDEGERRQWNEFKKGDQVQFHLKLGQVDYLIMVVPK